MNNIKYNGIYKKTKKGFTLAETLITLVVIGVVAALTVPNIIVNHQKEEMLTKLKKAYSTLSQSTNKAIADHGPITTWKLEWRQTKEFVDTYMLPYLSVAKNCGYETEGDCHFEYANLGTSSNKTVFGDKVYKLILNDGSVLLIECTKSNVNIRQDSGYVSVPLRFASIAVDINGQKGPNVYGKDIASFLYLILADYRSVGRVDYSGQFLPTGLAFESLGELNRSTLLTHCKTYGTSCIGLIMYDGWQIKDDYPW